jgi:hypothetical protein
LRWLHALLAPCSSHWVRYGIEGGLMKMIDEDD